MVQTRGRCQRKRSIAQHPQADSSVEGGVCGALTVYRLMQPAAMGRKAVLSRMAGTGRTQPIMTGRSRPRPAVYAARSPDGYSKGAFILSSALAFSNEKNRHAGSYRAGKENDSSRIKPLKLQIGQPLARSKSSNRPKSRAPASMACIRLFSPPRHLWTHKQPLPCWKRATGSTASQQSDSRSPAGVARQPFANDAFRLTTAVACGPGGIDIGCVQGVESRIKCSVEKT